MSRARAVYEARRDGMTTPLGSAGGALLAAPRGLTIAVLSQTASIVLLVCSVLAVAFLPLGVGMFALPVVVRLVRALANYHRRLAGWYGVEIPVPYRPWPERVGPPRRCGRLLRDPATWRDLLWLLLNIPIGLVAGLLPGCVLFYGIEGVLGIPLLVQRLGGRYGYGPFWPIDGPVESLLVPPMGAVILVVGLVIGPTVLRWYALFARSLLAPTEASRLASRVRHLTQTRAEAVDSQAAELRRIERDLHDGAQARLVALGMSIGLAEELMTRDPGAAQRILAEARESSGRALAELRSLVRGIHPPVLAERGLAGAVRAIALAVPLRVELDLELPGRPPPPVESAAYFSIAEALANVAKHSGAARAWVRMRHADALLAIEVGDDGRGGAHAGLAEGAAGPGVSGGTGLAGVARRLAAFDGTISVVSPPGGPTIVTMEVPCELSSPRTSPSSPTA